MQSMSAAIVDVLGTKDLEKINVLTAPTHERYQTNLSELGCKFYMVQRQEFKPWNHWQAPVPHNHMLVPQGKNIPNSVTMHLVLSQNKFGQIEAFTPVAKQFNIPLISLEHTWPHPQWTNKVIELKKRQRGDLNVFISEASVKAWGWDLDDPSVYVIGHGVDTNYFKPDPSQNKDGKVLTVANDYINRNVFLGFDIYQRVTEGFLTNPVGDTPNFSHPKGGTELVRTYQSASVFLNTSTHSPIPMSLLEAMSCGCCVVSTATCAIPEIIKHEENGFCTNDEKEMRAALKWSLENPDEAKKMGERARETILSHYSLDVHLESWKNLIYKALNTAKV